MATPTTMKLSARLNAGHQPTSRKSVTCPSRTRSIRFETLPPSRRPRAAGRTGCRDPERAKNQTIHATATAVSAVTTADQLTKAVVSSQLVLGDEVKILGP